MSFEVPWLGCSTRRVRPSAKSQTTTTTRGTCFSFKSNNSFPWTQLILLLLLPCDEPAHTSTCDETSWKRVDFRLACHRLLSSWLVTTIFDHNSIQSDFLGQFSKVFSCCWHRCIATNFTFVSLFPSKHLIFESVPRQMYGLQVLKENSLCKCCYLGFFLINGIWKVVFVSNS